jgi:hypothetical protein
VYFQRIIKILLILAVPLLAAAEDMTLWDILHDGPWKNPDFNYSNCTSQTTNATSAPFDSSGRFLKECAPEVLYSWQTQEMLGYYATHSTPQQLLPIQRLFAWRTPLYMYGFGGGVLRMKLRPETRFVLLPQDVRTYAIDNFGWNTEDARVKACQYWNNTLKAPAKTVFVAIYDQVSEYILCDDSAVESFSTNTPELLQELQWEREAMIMSMETKQFHHDRPVLYTGYPWEMSADGKDWSFHHFLENVTWIRTTVIENKYTDVYYAAGVPKSRTRHFSVSRPTYFLRRQLNPNEKIKSIHIYYSQNNEPWKEVKTAPVGNLTTCVGEASCYWTMPAVTSDDAFGVEWTCENSPKVHRFYSLGTYLEDGERTFLNSQFNIQCSDTSAFDDLDHYVFSGTPVKKMKVVSACYGNKNVTKLAADFCDGKSECEYGITAKRLDPSGEVVNPDFELDYDCGDHNLKRLHLPAPVENKIWNLSCDKEPQEIR